MRALADADRIRRLMRALGRAADGEGACYLTGGATAVLLGWLASTIDVDVHFAPETDRILLSIQRLKEELEINVELVSPLDFIPVPAGWEGRSIFAATEGRLTFYHFDPYAQALAKVERGHAQDRGDVKAMVALGLVVPERALAFFEDIEPDLFRFPAIDAVTFRRSAEAAFRVPGKLR